MYEIAEVNKRLLGNLLNFTSTLLEEVIIMVCNNCNKEIKDYLLLCPHCGTANPTDSLKNVELLNDYANKLQNLIKSVGTAEHTAIAWDLTVDEYVKKMEQLQVIISQPEFSKNTGERLMKRIRGFIDRCKDPIFHIAFVGTIKAGKSTLINAMLGRDLASTSVTPETAVLTKFRKSKSDYVRISFYSAVEWKQLWASISSKADVFMQEYKALNADSEKDKWIGHETITKSISEDALENEIERWTSSKHLEHYFVKEVEIGLTDFNLPDQIVFVDTPGLDDAVQYRSDVTRAYIDRANAVFACVNSGQMTGPELSTLNRIFTNSGDKPEKVFVLGTQWDKMNHPVDDWKKQKNEWVKYLSMANCYGNTEIAQKNIINVAAYLANLCRNYDGNKKTMKELYAIAMKFDEYEDIIDIPSDVEGHLEELIEKSNVSEVMRRINLDIVPKYKDFLMNDIVANYTAVLNEIKSFFAEKREAQFEVLRDSTKSADEIRISFEKAKKELEDVSAYREQLEIAMSELKANTDERVNELCKALQEMTKTA